MLRKYRIYSFITNFCASAQFVLSSHSMLSTVAKDTDIISYNFIGKDIVGNIGGLYFMDRYAKYADSSMKSFARSSNIIQQICVFTESITPFIPLSWFLPVSGFASIGRNVSFVGYGAINTKCILKLAEKNVGEMYSKLTMINTIASTAGMALGLILANYIPDHLIRSIVAIPILGAIRIYTFNKSIEDIVDEHHDN